MHIFCSHYTCYGYLCELSVIHVLYLKQNALFTASAFFCFDFSPSTRELLSVVRSSSAAATCAFAFLRVH